MIEYLVALLHALGFSLGVVMSALGSILIYQLFIQRNQFRSQMMMIGLSISLAIVGLTLLWLVLL